MKKKRVPKYLLQQGGVIPVEAPIGMVDNTTPLIQTASMPIDAGQNTILALRQEKLRRDLFKEEMDFRKQMAEKDDERWKAQLAWEKESFGRDMAFRQAIFDEEMAFNIDQFEKTYSLQEQQNEIQNAFAVVGLMQQELAGAGVGSRGSSPGSGRGSGIPLWTYAQQAAEDEVQQQIVEEFAPLVEKELTGEEILQSYTGSIMNVSKVKLRQAYSQAQHITSQYDQFMANPDLIDGEIFQWKLGKLSEEKSLLTRPQLNYENLNTAVMKIFESNKNFGAPDVYDIKGARVLMQKSPDIREQVADMLKSSYADALQTRHQMMLEKGTTSIEDYGQWADVFVNRLVNGSWKPEWKVNASDLNYSLETKKPDNDSSFGNNYGRSQSTDFKLEAIPSAEFVTKPNVGKAQMTGIGNISLNKYIYGEDGRAKLDASGKPLRVDDSRGTYIPDEQSYKHAQEAFEITAMMYPDKTYNLEDHITRDVGDDNEELLFIDEEGRRIVENYTDRLLGTFNSSPVVEYANSKQVSDEMKRQFHEQKGESFYYIPELGEILTGDEINKKFAPDKGKIENTNIVAVGQIGISNDYYWAAAGTDQVAHPEWFGVNPYVFRIKEEGSDKEYAVFMSRSEGYYFDNPDKVAANAMHNRATSGAGMPVKIDPERDLGNINLLIQEAASDALPEERKQFIAGNISTMSRVAKTDDLKFTYQGDAEGSFQVSDPTRIGDAAILTDYLTSKVNSDQSVEVIQLANGWGVKIDDNAMMQLSTENASNTEVLDYITTSYYSPEGSVNMMEYNNTSMKASHVPGINMSASKKMAHAYYNELFPDMPYHTFTSMYRKGDDGDHGKMNAFDLRVTDEMDEWIASKFTNDEGVNTFKVSPEGGYIPNPIPGTNFIVAKHRNEDPATGKMLPGWHYHFALNK